MDSGLLANPHPPHGLPYFIAPLNMNSAADQQILSAFEVSGMSPEEIAEDLGFSVSGVKAKLMSISSKYRKACGKEGEEEDELNFSRAEQLQIKRELFQLAVTTEDENLKGKLLLNLRDDGKGRKDVVKQMQGNQFNILQLVNNSLSTAREGASALKDSFNKQKSIPA